MWLLFSNKDFSTRLDIGYNTSGLSLKGVVGRDSWKAISWRLSRARLSSWGKGGKTMAAKAYVLIETSVGKTKDVVRALNKLKGMKEVHAVTGPYDVIAVVEGTDLTAVGNLVTNHIHPVGGIARTVTCLAIDVS
jgi:DNA-binding Lrp family transcriptional regulator